MFIQGFIQGKGRHFHALCEANGVSKIYAFGSAVTDGFDLNTSDIDLVVEIEEKDPIARGTKLMELWNQLETFFQRKVDMLTPSSIKNPVLKKSIEQSKVLIYER